MKDKFDLLQSNMEFEQKSELLSWFVDCMKEEVIRHFQTEGIYQEMDDKERIIFLKKLEHIQSQSKTTLFKLHQDYERGILVQENDQLVALQKEIADLQKQIDIIKLEKDQLDMIKSHNSSVDVFTSKFSQDNQLMKELKKLEHFKTPSERAMPTGLSGKADATTLKSYLFFNFDSLDELDKQLLTQYDRQSSSKYQTQEQRQARFKQEQDYKQYIVARHQLNYGQLFHNLEGGYNMEKLKKVLQRTQKDKEDGLHPFIDPTQEKKLDDQLRKVLKLNIDAKKSKAEGEEEKEEEADEDAEKVLTFEEQTIENIQDPEEKEIMQALMDLIKERKSSENVEDNVSEENIEAAFKATVTDAERQELLKYYEEETGAHLDLIEDEEEFKTAWIEWFKTKLPYHIR